MKAPLLSVRGLTRRFGGVTASDGIDLDVFEHEAHAIIGPNGAGKTTFIAQVAGATLPDAGTIELDGRSIGRLPAHRRARLGLARSFQITSIFATLTVLENAVLAAQAAAGHAYRMWGEALRDEGALSAVVAGAFQPPARPVFFPPFPAVRAVDPPLWTPGRPALGPGATGTAWAVLPPLARQRIGPGRNRPPGVNQQNISFH